MRFFSKSKEKELAVIFDVGSSSVGGAVFEIEKEGSPTISLSIREPIPFEKTINSERFLSLTLKTLEVVAGRISTAGFQNISKVFCVLSSPWYASQTRTIKLEKNTPFLFNDKLADNLIQKEIGLFEEENSSKFNSEDSIRLIEFKGLKTMLNDYPTKNPFNKKAKKLEMVVFISIGNQKILKKFENSILRHFQTDNGVKFSTFALASFTVARDMFMEQENFLLVDICGEITDVSIIKKDVLHNSISFPLGRNFIIRGVAKNLNCSLNEAKSYISLYKDGHAIEKVEARLESIMNQLEKEWLKEFQESLLNLSDDISIPGTIFISVDQDLTELFSKIIKTEQINQYALTESEFKIVFLDVPTLHGVASFKENVTRDPFIIIESLYLNRFIC